MYNYTDEQIKKALECCAYWHVDNCEKCPFDDECRDNGDFLLQKSLDIINRQEEEKAELQREIASYKSEIERLRKSNEELATESDARDIDETWIIARAKSEAIKEFAERLETLKKFRSCMTTSEYELSVTMREVDTVKKEMLKNGG